MQSLPISDTFTEERSTTVVRAAIYARVSTANNGQDPAMQTRELREYCDRRGWIVAGEYVDVGISGTKEKRPLLDRLMADAHQRRFDAVIVWKFDRFARSVSRSSLRLGQASSTSSGPANRRFTARKESGSDAFGGCLNSPESRTAMHTDSVTHSQWNSSYRACLLNVSLSCSAIRASASPNATTRHGCARGKSSSKPICSGHGAKILLHSWA